MAEDKQQEQIPPNQETTWTGTIHLIKQGTSNPVPQPKEQSPTTNPQPTTTYEKQSIKFTRVIAYATAIYAIASTFQLCAMRESNRTNREALISVQRAFVGLKTIESTGVRDLQRRVTEWRFYPQWENNGTTPTKTLRQHSNAGWRTDPLPPDFDFPDGGPTKNSASLIAPKAMITTGPILISPDIVTNVKDHRQRLYFWGWVAYRDIFQNSPAHLTEFCYDLTISDGDTITGEGIKFLWVQCDTHNCADDNCRDYPEVEKRLSGDS